MKYLGLLICFIHCFWAGIFSGLSIFTHWAAIWEKNHWAKSTALVFLPLLQKRDFQDTCWEIEVYYSVLESPFNTWRGYSQFVTALGIPYNQTGWRQEQDAVRGNTFLGKGTLFTCVSPQTRVSFGHWRLQATTALLGVLLRTQDEKKRGAIRLISTQEFEALNVLFLGVTSQCHIPNFHNLWTWQNCSLWPHILGVWFDLIYFEDVLMAMPCELGWKVHHTTRLAGLLSAFFLI